MMLLLSTASFQNEVKALRKQFGIKEGGNSTSEEHEKWERLFWDSAMDQKAESGDGHTKSDEYFRALNDLTRRYHLPGNFDRYTRCYVEMGMISWPVNSFDITPVGFPARSFRLNIYAKLPKKEQEDAFQMLDRTKEYLPSLGAIKDIDKLLESERIYEECKAYNQSKFREYRATVREYAESAEEETSTGVLYEHKRMLDDHRKMKFGKT